MVGHLAQLHKVIVQFTYPFPKEKQGIKKRKKIRREQASRAIPCITINWGSIRKRKKKLERRIFINIISYDGNTLVSTLLKCFLKIYE